MNIAIFASGAGSNAAVIIKNLNRYTVNNDVAISLIVTNNADSGILDIAKANNIPSEIIKLKRKSEEDTLFLYTELLKKYHIDFIVLAGYLKKIPTELIKIFPEKIINIHPALLPAYGGAGMYGMRVHEAVIASHEKESGITIHFVDEIYDNGKIIFQARCNVEPGENAPSLSKKVQKLEYENYSRVIANVLTSQNPVK